MKSSCCLSSATRYDTYQNSYYLCDKCGFECNVTPDNVKDMVHTLVKRSVDSVADSEARLGMCINFIKKVAKKGCDTPNNDGNCLGCYATDLLRKIGETS